MAYDVRIMLDSVNPVGDRLTTWVLTYPRFVHAELMTHRLFSRNSSSSRAIPTAKLIEQVKNDPAGPVWWGKNQKGMQAREELSYEPITEVLDGVEYSYSPRGLAESTWLGARDQAVAAAEAMTRVGVHKQIVNRLIEPWMWITVIVSATEFENWFALRDHKDAQPEIAVVATAMHHLYKESKPRHLQSGQWHLPFTEMRDRQEFWDAGNRGAITRMSDSIDQYLMQLSVGRCARVSYLTHEGKRDPSEDIRLHDQLAATDNSGDPGHYSPFEHQAMALPMSQRWGNFVGWKQYRKMFPHEHRGRDIESMQQGVYR